MRTPLQTTIICPVLRRRFLWTIGVVPTLYYAFTYKSLPEVGGIRLMGGPFESRWPRSYGICLSGTIRR